MFFILFLVPKKVPFELVGYICILTLGLRRKNSEFDNFCWVLPNLQAIWEF